MSIINLHNLHLIYIHAVFIMYDSLIYIIYILLLHFVIWSPLLTFVGRPSHYLCCSEFDGWAWPTCSSLHCSFHTRYVISYSMGKKGYFQNPHHFSHPPWTFLYLFITEGVPSANNILMTYLWTTLFWYIYTRMMSYLLAWAGQVPFNREGLHGTANE